MYMGFLRTEEKAFAKAISKLVYCNPFLPERIACEREALGDDFVPSSSVWSVRANAARHNPNVDHLGERATALPISRPENTASRATPGGRNLFVINHDADSNRNPQKSQAAPRRRLTAGPLSGPALESVSDNFTLRSSFQRLHLSASSEVGPRFWARKP